MQTYLVDIRGKDGHLGLLSTDSLEFAQLLDALLNKAGGEYHTEIKEFQRIGSVVK